MSDIRLSCDWKKKEAAKIKASRNGTSVSEEFQEWLDNEFMGEGLTDEDLELVEKEVETLEQ